ncbi:MAG: NAD(P)H-hydrate dehydratase [Gammaproteobacteria bacterium]
MSEFPARFYSSAQVRELDRRAIAGGITGYALMQRAAAAAWRELLRRWPRARRLCVLCGPGNNGGDGYELARLARDAGFEVQLFQVGVAPKSRDAASARKAWLAGGGKAHEYGSQALDGDVIVDGVFGIGLARAPAGAAQAAILAANAARARGAGVVALAVPSGLDADRGIAPGDAVRADLTVSFIGAKPGLHTADGPDFAGDVVLDDLQVPAAVYDGVDGCAEALRPALLASLLPRRARPAHKGDMGHVLLVGGEQGMAGAILLAARAALRAGAGWVSVATRAAHAAALTAAQPEIMCHGVEEPRALRPLLERASVVALGPGLGRSDWSRALWSGALEAPQPLVVDADGLNWLAENPQRRDARHENWVLTPHPGEAARLLGTTTAAIQADRPAAARALCERFGGVTVLKGAGTLVQGEELALCPYGNPGMAVGGMGDVLCGLIAGLLAQGLGPESAARVGVLVHALAGDRAAARGERGLVPGDLLGELQPLLNPLNGGPLAGGPLNGGP